MAIKTEIFYIGNREFTRTYSNANRYVVRDGISYSEACDPSEFERTYTEGDEIPEDEMPEIETNAEEILGIILGDENN